MSVRGVVILGVILGLGFGLTSCSTDKTKFQIKGNPRINL